ncbi:taurine catabolism dioxygenase [Purpureocillium lavendulum]|uniref:Taurine catabolism dioxygenase n=1 Tax=Purpureocillium lavendulum TaxID=1247861 RepID=A0AB34FH58_9HYPO|nr:taurine catabolism dioxygenase [Purpureocillium lavendulum]
MANATTNLTGPPGQPDIAYTPDWDKYQARVQRRRASEDLAQTLPDGFPAKLDSTLAWDGADVAERYDYAYHLTDPDLTEIHEALTYFRSLSKPLGEVNQQSFPLRDLHATLRSISRDVHDGYGFKVIRGVPIHKYSREENIIIYAGLAAHVASIRGRQDHQFNGKPADVVLAHIKDLSREFDAQSIGSPAYTTEKQVFHTDSGDIIALFALSSAEEGGESYLSSSWTVYNELAATRPDLIRILAEPWDVDEFGKTGPPGFTRRPLLYHQPSNGSDPERLLIQYARRAFVGYWGLPRSANIPAITEAQAEALDALHYTAEKHAVALEFRPGDIQFVNNLSIFHARGSFRDSAHKQRHLVRLWLRDSELAWKIPEALQSRWDRVYEGVTAENQVFPLEPSIRSASSGKPAQPILQPRAAVAAPA